MEIENGKNYNDVVANIEEWIPKAHLMVSAQTLKYLIRGGRVSVVRGFLGKMMGVQPLVKVNAEGKTELFGKPTSTKQSMRMVVDETVKLINGEKLWGYAIAHANNEKAAKFYASEMEQITGQKPKFISSVSPVIGTHVGPGVLGIAVLLD